MQALADRLEAARTLYAMGRVRKVLISGIETPGDPEVSAMKTWLDSHGVPSRDVLVDEQGTRTRETMLNAVAQFDVRSAVICTQSLHMPRSLFLARSAGIAVEGISLPTPLWSSAKWVGREILKNSLAFVESFLPSKAEGSLVASR